ncbi:MAG: hypothetical protein N2445_08780, partial [Acidobacteria bacterium]|nr:hypothetical protein [Acidobacteriota bacterium]
MAKLPLSTQRLILDLARSVENRHYVMQIIGGIDKVVAVHKAELDVVLGLPLNPDEIEMAKAADGARTIENIAAISKSNAFTTAKFFIGLHYLGLAHPKKIIESVNETTHVPESHQDERKLDLSFLDQALPTSENEDLKKKEESKEEEKPPFQAIVPEQETFKPLIIEEKTEPTAQPEEMVVEEVKKEKEEIVQPPLFSPTFLPPEEDKEIVLPEKPKIHLPPPQPLPRKRRSKVKIALASVGIIAVLVGLVFGILYIYEGSEKKAPSPPPSLPKVENKQKAIIEKTETKTAQTPAVKEESKPPAEVPVQSAVKTDEKREEPAIKASVDKEVR